MSKIFSLFVFLFLIFCLPASAGQVNYNEGKGKWIPTGCQTPAQPPSLDVASDIPADQLNNLIAAHNVFAADAQTYMDCVSKEAQRDAEAMNIIIIGSAKSVIDGMQAKVEQSARQVEKR